MPAKRPLIRDSTLREGLELPGVELSLAQKLRVAALLDRLGVRELEIGMPYGLGRCLSLAAAIRARGLRLRTSALVLVHRAGWRDEIDRAAGSALDRVELLVPASEILLGLRDYYALGRDRLPALLAEALAHARARRVRAGVGFVDATRTDPDFLVRLLRAARRGGADRAIVYDTTGVATPRSLAELVAGARRRCPLPIQAHCHNDFGLATANTLAALEAGAAGADVVANGLGDRGGNAALEEVVLALELLHGVRTGIRLEHLSALSALVERLSGIPKCRVKPVVGEFTFLHSPVQHIRNAAAGNRRAFEPFPPETVGAVRRYAFTLPVDYRDAIAPFLRRLGLDPERVELAGTLAALRAASRARGITERETLAIVRRTARRRAAPGRRG